MAQNLGSKISKSDGVEENLMKNRYNDIIIKDNRKIGAITILLLIILAKITGIIVGVLLNISNEIISYLLDIFLTAVFFLVAHYKFPIAKIEGISNIEELKIKRELRKALKKNEFIIHYQPQVDIETKKIIRCEALLRWNHPKMGIIPPQDFIPLAEKTGLIIPIGKWVLREASKQLKKWHKIGFNELKLSVNISACQFQDPYLAETISDILNDIGLDPKFLELEITESNIMQNTELATETIKKLKSMGIKIAIDDFGAGFSSLSYIRKFFADIVKIDKSFVWNVTHNSSDAALTAAIIHMANILNISVVAEGVETKEQLDFLYSNGCKQIQGYIISPPIAPSAFEQLLSQEILA